MEVSMRRISLLLAFILICTLCAIPASRTLAQNTTYTVQPGDNLFRIALKYGTSVSAIAQLNNISNPALIYVGEVLKIPNGSTAPAPTNAPAATSAPSGGNTGGSTSGGGTYTVQRGDTLSSIGAKFGVTYL